MEKNVFVNEIQHRKTYVAELRREIMEKMTKDEIEGWMKHTDNLLWWMQGLKSANTDASFPPEWQTVLVIAYQLLEEKLEK